MADVDWDKLSFVKRSEQRLDVLSGLEGPSMPSELAEELGMHQSHVSRALSELEEKDLVKILNPDAHRGRLYRRTEEAEKILERI